MRRGPPSPADAAGMEAALRLARAAAVREEVPVGAVVIRDGVLLAEAHNETVVRMDPTAHAEFLALQRRIVGDRGLRAVVSTRVAERSLEEVAAEENISVQTLYVRRIRAEQQLARQRQLSQLARAG